MLVVGFALAVPLLVVLAVAFQFDPHEIPSPLIGTEAPLFALEDLNGSTIRLANLRGRPAVINFWATWCPPCVVEHPTLVEAARRYQGRAHFLGIVYQDEPEAIRQFVVANGAWGPALTDPGNRTALAYGVYGAPETFIVDREGVIVEKITGAMTRDSIDRLLGPLL